MSKLGQYLVLNLEKDRMVRMRKKESVRKNEKGGECERDFEKKESVREGFKKESERVIEKEGVRERE